MIVKNRFKNYSPNTGCAPGRFLSRLKFASRLSPYLPVISGAVLAVCLAAAVSSCVKLNERDFPDIPDEGEDAYITLSIGTRAHSQNEDPGDCGERMVGIVRMVLYSTNADPQSADPSDYEVVRAFDFLIRSICLEEDGSFALGYEEWSPEQDYMFKDTGYPPGEHLYRSSSAADDDYFITWARKVPRRDYKMLILVNADNENSAVPTSVPSAAGTRNEPVNMDVLGLTAPGRKLSEFLASAEVRIDYGYVVMNNLISNYGFVMTNSMGLVDVPAASLAASVDDAHANPFPVAVDRVVAKVMVTGDPSGWDVPDGAALNNVCWGINNYNKRFYWMRRQTNIIDNSAAGGGVGALETDVYPDPYNSSNVQRASIYAEDPNFEGISGNGGLVEENFLKAGIYGSEVTPFYLDPENIECKYVLENTMAGREQQEDVMTSVVVSAQYAPQGFSVWQSYFQYNGIFVSEETALDYYWGRIQVPPGLAGIVEAMRSASETIDYDDDRGTAYLLTLYDDYLSASRGFNHRGLNYYFNGTCFYNIPIRHSGGDITDRNRYSYGNYGVVRNNIYTIHINGINGLGSPEIGGKGYLSARISVMDWSTHETIVDVGEEVFNAVKAD